MDKFFANLLLTLLVLFDKTIYVYGNSCPASTPTVKIVWQCPANAKEWNAAASKKNCERMTSHNCGTFVYHCLPNQHGNAFIEVCAPEWYISGFCAMFNTDEERVIDNFDLDCTEIKEEDGGCPTRYISSQAYKYQYCYDKVKNSISVLPFHPQENDTSKVMNESTDGDFNVFTILFALAMTAVIALGVILILIYKGVIWKKGEERHSGSSEEGKHLLSENTEGKDKSDNCAESTGKGNYKNQEKLPSLQSTTAEALLTTKNVETKNSTEAEEANRKGEIDDLKNLKCVTGKQDETTNNQRVSRSSRGYNSDEQSTTVNERIKGNSEVRPRAERKKENASQAGDSDDRNILNRPELPNQNKENESDEANSEASETSDKETPQSKSQHLEETSISVSNVKDNTDVSGRNQMVDKGTMDLFEKGNEKDDQVEIETNDLPGERNRDDKMVGKLSEEESGKKENVQKHIDLTKERNGEDPTLDESVKNTPEKENGKKKVTSAKEDGIPATPEARKDDSKNGTPKNMQVEESSFKDKKEFWEMREATPP